MMKRRGLILVILSLAMGGTAAWAANNWVQQRLTPANVEESYDVVVAAATSIPYGVKVEQRHMRVLRLPEGTAPEGAFQREEHVEGKVATVDVARGEILLRERFADHEGGSTLAALVQANMRAVTLRVDDVVGVAGFLLPGNRVDVLSTRIENSTRRAVTETILQNIKVLAVDQTARTERNDPVIVRAVTLELTPPQSEQLVKAREEGRIQLTLRNPLDPLELVAEPEPQPEPARPAVVPAPRPAAPTQTTVTIIRGTQVGNTRARQ
jgi:pilus assembly protein CpaB